MSSKPPPPSSLHPPSPLRLTASPAAPRERVHRQGREGVHLEGGEDIRPVPLRMVCPLPTATRHATSRIARQPFATPHTSLASCLLLLPLAARRVHSVCRVRRPSCTAALHPSSPRCTPCRPSHRRPHRPLVLCTDTLPAAPATSPRRPGGQRSTHKMCWTRSRKLGSRSLRRGCSKRLSVCGSGGGNAIATGTDADDAMIAGGVLALFPLLPAHANALRHLLPPCAHTLFVSITSPLVLSSPSS